MPEINVESKTIHEDAVEAVRKALIETANRHDVNGLDRSEQVLRLADAYDRIRSEY